MRKLICLSMFLLAAFAVQARAQSEADESSAANTGVAIFAGGCFWCVEADFDKVDGVKETVSGYIGGEEDNPTYKTHVANGDREAVRITYDPSAVSYDELLKTFFRTVDPTDDGGQFCDRGFSYTTAVYTVNAAQAEAAQEAKADAADALGKPVVTEIVDASEFWPAEEYHQNYYKKNPIRYRYYRYGCGRDSRVEELWGSAANYGLEKS
ncbi:MAG: peptide-methionine (S)-S-oxide reductase MsrA [Hoeflea sp.]|uniref:peptide-methionine (S)-S-oxide reductase MsrA n=1 Tax=Hoeflea sp. TaxID=1940281 RepID=UPI0032F0329B